LNENEDSKTLSDRQNARISGDVGLWAGFSPLHFFSYFKV